MATMVEDACVNRVPVNAFRAAERWLLLTASL
jgi:hypothetical protein